jgi:hypothetical protein
LTLCRLNDLVNGGDRKKQDAVKDGSPGFSALERLETTDGLGWLV